MFSLEKIQRIDLFLYVFVFFWKWFSKWMELVVDVNAHVYACCTLFLRTHWIEFQVQVRSANGQFDSYELVGADRRWRRQQQFSLNAPQFTTNLDTKISSLVFFFVLFCWMILCFHLYACCYFMACCLLCAMFCSKLMLLLCLELWTS